MFSFKRITAALLTVAILVTLVGMQAVMRQNSIPTTSVHTSVMKPQLYKSKRVAVSKAVTKKVRPKSAKRVKAFHTSAAHTCATFPLTDAERIRVERVVMASCGELDNYTMAKANAQVILDRVKSGRFGRSIFSVLDAPGQFETPWRGRVNGLVRQAVSAVFDRGERVTQTAIFYYENPNHSVIDDVQWSRGKRYVITVGHGIYIHQYWTDRF